ncbi:MAG TPA: hypothetical protein VFD92_27985 [Candidatus Binatia bacterium]|nr:hypothetical protein [Candidatus Binatia bacterium]
MTNLSTMAHSTSDRVLGLRAEPRAVQWAVVKGTQAAPILEADGRSEAPKSFDEPAALSWMRQQVLDLVATYAPTAVGVRFAEHFRPGGRQSASNREADSKRSRMEGVVLEAAHSRNLPILAGSLATISSRLHTRKAKDYIDSASVRGLDLSDVPKPRREAVLVAIAQLPESSAETTGDVK